MVNAVRLIVRFVLRPHEPARILFGRGAASVAPVGRVQTMYRVIAIIGGALTLAACSSSSDLFSLDALKPAPAMDTVRFESDPPGAEAKASTGQTCTTPCALALPTSGPVTVTFTLAGYQPETQSLDVVSNTGSPPTLQPNPVSAELTAAAPAPKAKKPVRKRAKTSAKPGAAAAPPELRAVLVKVDCQRPSLVLASPPSSVRLAAATDHCLSWARGKRCPLRH